MICEYYILGKIPYKIERGGRGGQAILYEYKIANLPKLLILSLRIKRNLDTIFLYSVSSMQPISSGNRSLLFFVTVISVSDNMIL